MEPCDIKVKVEVKVDDCGDLGQDGDGQVRGNITKRYCPYDDLDEEPFQPPKLRRYVHSTSHVGKRDKTDFLTPCEDAKKFPQKSDRKDAKVKMENSSMLEKGLEYGISLESYMTQETQKRKKEGTNKTASNDSDNQDVGWQIKSREQEITEKAISGGNRVLYVHSDKLIEHCDRLPRISDRAGMVHSLIESLGLLSYLEVVAPEVASEEEVKKFHSEDYVEFLKCISHLVDEEHIESEESDHYGITYDCPVQQGVYDCAALVAGATMMGAKALCDGQCDIAINWCGGWHHAQKSEASGFCYINDIVLGILTLRQKFSRVLYVDLDLHHGDGVENAFSTTPHVMTVSFHKYEMGFFPGTGSLTDVGSGKGKYYCVNVPLNDGLDDRLCFSAFQSVMACVREAYSPEVLVCQCGADALAGDPMASFNLTLTAYRQCLFFLMGWKLPLLLLGGGGYHHANTARLWASLTALAVGRKLPQDVPEHKYFTKYGPDYELTVKAGNRKNSNSHSYMEHICNTITENLQKIKGKPV